MEIEKQALNAVLEKPYKFGIVDRQGRKREFTIKPPCLACLLAVSQELADMDLKQVLNSNKIDTIKYTDKMVRVACFVIKNSDKYTKELFDFVKHNLNATELYELFTEAVLRLKIEDFQKSIVLTTQMSLITNRS